MKSTSHIVIGLALCTGLAVAAACNKSSQATSSSEAESTTATASAPPADTEDAVAAAHTKFKECVVCHGQDGRGDGPGAAALTPKPRDYTDPKWQASVTDQQIADTIVKGGAAVGKSALMPSHPELRTKPKEVAELVKIIRGFKK
jgi:cytochrome c553